MNNSNNNDVLNEMWNELMNDNQNLDLINRMIELNNTKIENLRLYLAAYNSAGFWGRNKWKKTNKEYQKALKDRVKLDDKREDLLYGTHNEIIDILEQRIEKLKKMETKAAVRLAKSRSSKKEEKMNNYIKIKKLLEDTKDRKYEYLNEDIKIRNGIREKEKNLVKKEK